MEARENMGMSRETLADVCLLDLSELRDFEEGRIELGESAMRFLCNVLDISAPALRNGAIEKRITPEKLNALAEEMDQVSAQLRKESAWLQSMVPPEELRREHRISGPTI